jgi:Four helix bundle sensory module for signal transduction
MLQSRHRFWIIVSLLASNLVVGVLSLLFLRTVNERYATLFESSVPVINQLRTLTRDLGNVQRLARRVSDPANETDWRELLAQLDDSSDRARVHALEISRLELFRETSHAAAITVLSREYDENVDRFLALVKSNKVADAVQFNAAELRPCYDRFQQALDRAAAFVERQGNDLRDQYAQDSRFFGGLLLALAGWPLLAVALGVVVMGLLIAALLVTTFAPAFGSRRGPGPSAD